MNNHSHLSDEDLLRFEDGELPEKLTQNIEAHLQRCPACQNRLQQLQDGILAYHDYREQVLQRSLPLPTTEWPSLRPQLEALDERKKRKKFLIPPKFFWAAAACACALLALYQFAGRRTDQEQMQQLLTQSAALPPPPPQTRLLLTVQGRRWLRPAVLRPGERSSPVAAADRSTSDHLQTLFIKANYSWEDPLSARSFARWRDQLPEKQDQVTTIRDESGAKRFYRLQTKTAASLLHTASLTLRADTSRTVKAFFGFAGKEDVEMEEQEPEEKIQTRASVRNTPAASPKTTETLATPEDMLQVLAALNAIGADEDPIDVNFDPLRQHVVVSGIGLSPARQSEVKDALQDAPHTLVRFGAGLPTGTGRRSNPNPDTYSANTASAFRRRLEEKAGGASSLQLITDRALEASNRLFAQAHALLVLAQKFPPAVEGQLGPSGQGTLRTLRQRHAFALQQTTLQLGEALKPLLESSSATGEFLDNQIWQKKAVELFETARNLDARVSRLLTGYSEETGEGDLRQLPNDLEKVEQLARTQAGNR